MKKLLSVFLCFALSFLFPAAERSLEADRVSILAVGDNIIHGAVYADAARNAATLTSTGASCGAYSFEGMYDNVRSRIGSADIAFVNQEGPIIDRSPSGYPRFSAPVELADALSAVGFDVVNLANNHALDQGRRGVEETLTHLRERELLPIGTYGNAAEKDRIPVLEKNGLRIAFLAYTCATNGISLPADSPCGVHYAETEAMTAGIRQAKALADFVIVSVHWGEEGSFRPTEAQRSMAQSLSAAGADVILGHHSHTLAPIEWLPREDGGKTLVAYSLGNFLSGMLYPQYMVGGMLTLDLCRGADGKTVENVRLIPTVCHYGKATSGAKTGAALKTRSGLRIYPLESYTEGMVVHHGAHLYASFNRQTLLSYVTETVDPRFLPSYFITTP